MHRKFAAPFMSTDYPYLDTLDSTHKPDFVDSSGPDDKIGLILFSRRHHSLVSQICWGTLDASGSLRTGIVRIQWRDQEPAEPSDKEKLRIYANAARALNRRLKNVIVEKIEFSPTRSRETSFYEEAQIKPSWKRIHGDAYAVLRELRLDVAKEVGFTPYLRPWQADSTEERIALQLAAYRALRLFHRRMTNAIDEYPTSPKYQHKRYEDVIPG